MACNFRNQGESPAIPYLLSWHLPGTLLVVTSLCDNLNMDGHLERSLIPRAVRRVESLLERWPFHVEVITYACNNGYVPICSFKYLKIRLTTANDKRRYTILQRSYYFRFISNQYPLQASVTIAQLVALKDQRSVHSCCCEFESAWRCAFC